MQNHATNKFLLHYRMKWFVCFNRQNTHIFESKLFTFEFLTDGWEQFQNIQNIEKIERNYNGIYDWFLHFVIYVFAWLRISIFVCECSIVKMNGKQLINESDVQGWINQEENLWLFLYQCWEKNMFSLFISIVTFHTIFHWLLFLNFRCAN